MRQCDDNTNDPLTLFISTTTPPPKRNTLIEKESPFKNASVLKARLEGRKDHFLLGCLKRQTGKQSLKSGGCFPCQSTSPTSRTTAAQQPPAYWSGIVCQGKSPQYVTSVLSGLKIHSHLVTHNTDKFKFAVALDLFLNLPLVLLFGIQIKWDNLPCPLYMDQVASYKFKRKCTDFKWSLISDCFRCLVARIVVALNCSNRIIQRLKLRTQLQPQV